MLITQTDFPLISTFLCKKNAIREASYGHSQTYVSRFGEHVLTVFFRRPGEEGDAASMETSSASNSDCEADRRLKSLVDGSRNQQNLMNSNSQRLNKLALRDKSVIGSSSDEAEISSSPGLLSFEYLEQEQPHNRRPLTDKVYLTF